MIIIESILTIYELSTMSSIFGGSCGSNENWLEPKTELPWGNIACSNP